MINNYQKDIIERMKRDAELAITLAEMALTKDATEIDIKNALLVAKIMGIE